VLIEEILVYGAISGGMYALLALGFTLIYGVSGVVNLAHGSFFMVGTYLFYVFSVGGFFSLIPLTLLDPTWGPVAALILAIAFTGVISAALYRIIIHPVLGDEIGVMVVTVSLALIIQQLILMIFGPPNLRISPLVTGSQQIWGLGVTNMRLLAFGVSLIFFIVLWIFTNKSKVGNAMRAISQDREAAMLMGINTERLYMLTMALSAMLAAAAGVFITASITEYAAPWIWLHPLALSFSIVILGGLGSIKGSLLGGFIVGYAEQAVAIGVPEGGSIISIVPFTVMVVVLLLRPKGLFGKRIEMEE
jgi:branched-chain amino acid transport system permease protein